MTHNFRNYNKTAIERNTKKWFHNGWEFPLLGSKHTLKFPVFQFLKKMKRPNIFLMLKMEIINYWYLQHYLKVLKKYPPVGMFTGILLKSWKLYK